uniref:Putative methyltransferase n=1 Tax=viral metagenome TaxID=1070528 RepID=A0A6M3JHP1_9ZZZZ
MGAEKQEACQLYIEQEIERGLAEGKTSYSLGKEIAVWIEKLFEVKMKPQTIEKRAQRVQEDLKTNVFIEPTSKEHIPPKFIIGTENEILAKASEIRKEKKVERDLKEKELKAEIIEQPIPSNKYQTIVVDPPWPVKKIIRDDRPNQGAFDYPTMSIEEIVKLKIPDFASDDCHIYLWTTHKFLPVSFLILEEWGFKYQCLLTWVKNVGMTPFSWMYSTEHCLFGRKGSLNLMKLGERLDFNGKVREHSRKPNEFYELVKKVSPRPRIDCFSREQREGFDQFGNEQDRF